MKSEGSRLALVQNPAILPDQVESVRPSGIGSLYLIIESVDHSGKFDAELAHTGTADGSAFSLVLWTRKKHLIGTLLCISQTSVGWASRM